MDRRTDRVIPMFVKGADDRNKFFEKINNQ